MAIEVEHELHRRRFGRNMALGGALIAFVALVFGLTIVKVSRQGHEMPAAATTTEANP